MNRDECLHDYIASARWFGGKGRDFTVGQVRELTLGVLLVTVEYADGPTDVYQVPLSAYGEPQDRIGHAFVGEWDDAYWYDAVHDRDAMGMWLEAFAESAKGSPLTVDGANDVERLLFHRLPGHELDLAGHSTLFSGEQSNSSVAFGDDSLLKVFRRVTAGVNPDIEIHAALTKAESEHIASLYGWVETMGPQDGGDEPKIQLGMLQQFLRTAMEGWASAQASVRNLFAEADLYPEEVGGDFAAEARRLGAAVAEVHVVLRSHFATTELDPHVIAGTMRRRLAEAQAVVPELEEVAGPVRAAFDRLGELDRPVPAQRVHGDLHLGQTLRTSLGWKLVDFEGEPAKPLSERVLPDSPWRDVAGMLRSFDYAARSVQRDVDVDNEAAAQLDYRAGEWVQRNHEAFLAGYSEIDAGVDSELSETDQVLLSAYELDKAVYEVIYEARNRPAWLDIPMAALARAGEAR